MTWWTVLLIVFVLALALAGLSAPGVLRWRKRRARERVEHALKAIYDHGSGEAVPVDRVAGELGLSLARTSELMQRMEARQLVRSHLGGLELTESGHELALHIVRAHRLLERYLADDAGVAMADVHTLACRAEHDLTPEDAAALEEHLGRPRTDPHGDPIPTTSGEPAPPAPPKPLTDWPVGKAASVYHIEDEPRSVMRQIAAAGVRPGHTIAVTRHTADAIAFESGGEEVSLSPVVAANIHVVPATGEQEPPAGELTLADASRGQTVRVLSLGEGCRGFTRRRLLDLGMTPGAVVRVELANPTRSAQAYRVRDTLIALRREQASQIAVERVKPEESVA